MLVVPSRIMGNETLLHEKVPLRLATLPVSVGVSSQSEIIGWQGGLWICASFLQAFFQGFILW